MYNTNSVYHRGDIFFAQLTAEPGSHRQCGTRPVLVVSNETNNRFSPVITVVPLTSNINKKFLPTHVLLDVEGLKPGIALCEQILTIDKTIVTSYAGTLRNDQASMQAVNKAMLIQLGMPTSTAS